MAPPTSLEEVKINSIVRKTLTCSIPGELKWDATLPAEARLQFSLAINPEDSQGSMFASVEVAGKKVFEDEIKAGRAWLDREIDLAEFSGRAVAIVFRTRPGQPGNGKVRALWGNPAVTGTPLDPRRNFLIISIDTLRADHLGCYGYGRPTSPTIDDLARKGMRFKHAYTAQSSTWPALTTLMTSLQPSTHGVTWNGYKLRTGVIALAEIFSAEGYATGAFIANMGRGTHRGYDQRFVYNDGRLAKNYLGQLWSDRNKPFFHWIHFMAPHDSYNPPKPYDGMFGKVTHPGIGRHNKLTEITKSGRPPSQSELDDIIRLYDGEIRSDDDLIRRILDELHNFGLDEKTVIILTADHGEQLYDHKNYSFHSGTVDNSTLHIPLIIKGSRELGAGTVDPTPVGNIDIAPTILQIAGIKAPPGFQGQSLLLPPEKRRGEVLSETWEQIFTLADSRYRYVHNPKNIHPLTEAGGYPFAISNEEFFDMTADPLQKHDVLSLNRRMADQMKARLLEWKNKVAGNPVEKQVIDKQTEEELKALGYVHE